MPDRISENPYKILEVSPLASNAEITKAFALAIKQRKYPPDEIARARKSLMNPDERIIADYLNPIMPLVKRFKSSESEPVEQAEPLVAERWDLERIDRLIEIEIDKIETEQRDNDIELANLAWDV
jgi:hypothetical protein